MSNLLRITDKFKDLNYFTLDKGKIMLVDDTYGNVIDVNNETKDYAHLKSKEQIRLRAGKTYCLSFLGKGIWVDAYVMVNDEWQLLKTDWQRFSVLIKPKQDEMYNPAMTVSGNTRVHVTQFQLEEADKPSAFESGSGEIPIEPPTPSKEEKIKILQDDKYGEVILVSNKDKESEVLTGVTDIELQANKMYTFSYYAKSDSDCTININGQNKNVSNNGTEDFISFTAKENEKFTLHVNIKGNHKITFADFKIEKKEDSVKLGRVTIQYLNYKTGMEVGKSDIITDNVGKAFTVTPKSINGYKYYYAPNGMTGKFTEKDQTIYLYYNEIEQPTPIIGKIVVEYLDYNDNNEIASNTTITGEIGTDYKIDIKKIYGYDYTLTYDSLNGKFAKDTKTIRLMYTKKSGVEPIPPTPSKGDDIMGIATGQYTIVDFNDAPYLSAFIYSNHAKTQFFNPDTNAYIPDWSSNNLVLTPSILKMGDATSGDLVTSSNIQNITWYEEINGQKTKITNGGNFSLSGNNNQTLTIKSNILEKVPAIRFIFEANYKDEITQLILPVMTDIDFSKVCNGGGITAAMCFAPKGNVFKNESMKTLVATCDLWRGSTVDTTNVEYQWYVQEGTTSDEGAGVGWKKLTQSDNRGVTGYTTREVIIPADAVPSFECFKCVITDMDSSSNTYKKTFQDVITFTDNSDPVQVEVQSTGGNIFKNGVGSTTLIARTFRGGAEIDLQGTKYTYRWSKYDKDERQDTSFGTNGYKDGKKLAIGSDDVYVKATFNIDLLRK